MAVSLQDFLKGENKMYADTGSTLLNLAITDRTTGGFPLGSIVNVIGDSSSGKTFLALTVLACAANDTRFNNYNLILDDAEHADNFDKERLFGKKASSRIKSPSYDEDGEPVNSELFEDFEVNIQNQLDSGKPFIYVLDSFDSLSDQGEQKHTDDRIKAYEKGKESKGSYGMSKPKLASEFFRKIVGRLRKSNSLLIIISQTRDNINPMSFSKKTRSGGRALKFYSSIELWTAEEGHIKKKEESVGIYSKLKISKNKVNGKRKTVSIPIYYSYGVDDIGSCIDYLMSQKAWTLAGQTITTKNLGKEIKGTKDKVIKAIEEDKNLQKNLKKAVADVWKKFEDSLQLGRRCRFE